MPIYEYACRACGSQFEVLVRPGDVPACPSCASEDLEKLLSSPAIRSNSTHAAALNAARRRDTKLGADAARAQREYELKHND